MQSPKQSVNQHSSFQIQPLAFAISAFLPMDHLFTCLTALKFLQYLLTVSHLKLTSQKILKQHGSLQKGIWVRLKRHSHSKCRGWWFMAQDSCFWTSMWRDISLQCHTQLSTNIDLTYPWACLHLIRFKANCWPLNHVNTSSYCWKDSQSLWNMWWNCFQWASTEPYGWPYFTEVQRHPAAGQWESRKAVVLYKNFRAPQWLTLLL